ncbi:MAG: ABC transporter substrate-binding protein [Cyclobacteriaceae bacterium]
MIRFLLVLWLGLMLLNVSGQQNKAEFAEAKRLYSIGEYQSAASAFSSLTADPMFAEYATFYYALSTYNNGSATEAIDGWKQVLSLYPNWNQIPEVLFWIAKVSFEQGNLKQGLEYLDSYTNLTNNASLSKQLVPKYFESAELSELIDFQSKYPGNRQLAFQLASKIMSQPASIRDQSLLDQLIGNYGFDMLELMNVKVENVKKDRYSVAVTLPFMFEGIDKPLSVMRNSLIMNFYQGMLLGNQKLSDDGVNIDLFCYDTQKSTAVTKALLPKLEGSDLIVGPLYPGPIDVIKEYSSNSHMYMFNPLSNNEEYIESNPFAYLARPTYRTMARALGEYVVGQHNRKSTLVYYAKNDRDSVFAATYKDVIEEAGFNVVRFTAIDELEAKLILDSLVETFEEYYEQEVADSISEIEGRFIKTRRLRDAEDERNKKILELIAENKEDTILAMDLMDDFVTFFQEELEDGELDDDKMVAYESKLKVPKDSIGHILIAGRSNTIVNNLISAVAARSDSTGLYGYGDWTDFKVVNYVLLEQIGVKIAVPDYIDESSEEYELRSEEIQMMCRCIPSEYHFAGYDFMMYVGKMLSENGKYFQNGADGSYSKGNVLEGFRYGTSNDNQVVPIVTLQDLELIPLNRSNYADKK